MSGLARLCKLYGKLELIDKEGKKVLWVYDYAQDKPRIKCEMTKAEIKESERVKYLGK